MRPSGGQRPAAPLSRASSCWRRAPKSARAWCPAPLKGLSRPREALRSAGDQGPQQGQGERARGVAMEGGQQIAPAVVSKHRGRNEVAAAQAHALQEGLHHAGDVLQALGIEIMLRHQEQGVPRNALGPSSGSVRGFEGLDSHPFQRKDPGSNGKLSENH